MVGTRLGPYDILEPLGAGGMGEVYLAEDSRLGRQVAIKVLPAEVAADAERVARLEREARLLAAVNHPSIATLFELEEVDGVRFLVMELIEGETLAQRIRRGPVPLDEAVALARQVASGLEAAHARSIIHRDLKPANVMVGQDGVAKILDFGIAKTSIGDASAEEVQERPTAVTALGVTLGTIGYMSPEQLRGEAVDEQCDIWAFGCLLYELLTGLPAFARATGPETSAAILSEEANFSLLPPGTPMAVRQLLKATLAKDPEARLRPIGEARERLDDLASPRRGTPRRAAWWLAAAALAVIGVFSGWLWIERSRVRWANEVALPEIERLIAEQGFRQAFPLALEAERYIPDSQRLSELWPQLSRPLAVVTDPEGAEVYAGDARDPSGIWRHLGTTPVEVARYPMGALMLRIEKAGYETTEGFGVVGNWTGAPATMRFRLPEAGMTPAGMVYVPAKQLRVDLAGLDSPDRFAAPEYSVDRHEVTNREYKQFVDAGGYASSEHWLHEFVREGAVVSWAVAMEAFRDQAGRRGPSTWAGGTYPDGQDDYPVVGVSWYEAAAYAAFVGKRLPTVYHWLGATRTALAPYMLDYANFGGAGPVSVGSGPVGPRGTYDMAGNAREWAYNGAGNGRFWIMGGAWDDPSYAFYEQMLRDGFDRSSGNGFRCADYADGDREIIAELEASLELPTRDYGAEVPVSDEVFEAYASLYDFDPQPLEAQVEAVEDDSAYWRRERVSFNAARGHGRIPAYLYLPKGIEPPYQAVVFFPGSGAILRRDYSDREVGVVDFVIMNGRALLVPIYRGTYERIDGLEASFPHMGRSYVDYLTSWVNEVRASVDYLEDRDDIDGDAVGYLGVSWGARLGSIVLALEPRFKAAVLVVGGFPYMRTRPEGTEVNFAPRVTTPVLMLNGEHDAIFPRQYHIPMFELLGTPEADKRQVVYDGGHGIIRTHREPVIDEALRWFARYLGPVQ